MGNFFKGYDMMPMKPVLTIVNVECGDWEAMYVNGKIWLQGHCFTQSDWVELIEEFGTFNQDIEVYEVTDEYAESCGYLPDKFDDIPKGAFM